MGRNSEQLQTELIDTLWNVNFIKALLRSTSDLELIDTLWNVNFSTTELNSFCYIELIDTLWNVNCLTVMPFGILFSN